MGEIDRINEEVNELEQEKVYTLMNLMNPIDYNNVSRLINTQGFLRATQYMRHEAIDRVADLRNAYYLVKVVNRFNKEKGTCH